MQLIKIQDESTTNLNCIYAHRACAIFDCYLQQNSQQSSNFMVFLKVCWHREKLQKQGFDTSSDSQEHFLTSITNYEFFSLFCSFLQFDFLKHVNISSGCSRHLVWLFFSGCFCTFVFQLQLICSVHYVMHSLYMNLIWYSFGILWQLVLPLCKIVIMGLCGVLVQLSLFMLCENSWAVVSEGQFISSHFVLFYSVLLYVLLYI